MGVTSRAAKEQVRAAKLNKLIKAHGSHEFTIGGPCTLTILNRKDQYKKHPFLGGESFRLASVYVGKRGDLIFVFVPDFPVEFRFVEVMQKDLYMSFSSGAIQAYLDEITGGWSEWLERMDGVEDSHKLSEAKEKIKKEIGVYGGSFGAFS